VAAIAPSILPHRLIPNFAARSEGVTSDDITRLTLKKNTARPVMQFEAQYGHPLCGRGVTCRASCALWVDDDIAMVMHLFGLAQDFSWR
jgi:hypothetical protein